MEASKTYQQGDEVKFRPEYDDGDNQFRIEVLEDNGNRVLVRFHNGMGILPTQTVLKEWLQS